MESLLEPVKFIFDFLLHVDAHLKDIIANYGSLTYPILFLIIFCETGLIVTPYLPGDSLLFAAGAFAGMGLLNIQLLMACIFAAAVLGDATNFWTARFAHKKLTAGRFARLIKREHLERTQEFFQRYGAKTIVLARFVPIVRTFAPFVAGLGQMNPKRFTTFNIVGAAAWVAIFVLAGFYFGNIPVIQKNFTLLILGIIFVSVLPLIYEFVRARLGMRGAKERP